MQETSTDTPEPGRPDPPNGEPIEQAPMWAIVLVTAVLAALLGPPLVYAFVLWMELWL